MQGANSFIMSIHHWQNRQTHFRFYVASLLIEMWACQIILGINIAAIVKQARSGLLPTVARAWVIFCLLGVFYIPLASVAAAPTVEIVADDSGEEVNQELVLSEDSINMLSSPLGDGSTESIVEDEIKNTFQAVVTQYSQADSCHNRRNGECVMSSGRAVYVGAVACPYFLDLGTKIIVDGNRYTCEDRYAVWLDRTRAYPTIDIFVENNPHGNSVRTVSVL